MLRSLLVGFLVVGLALWCAAPVFAEKVEAAGHNAEAGEKPHDDKSHEEHADGRSDFMKLIAEQGLWTIVVFVILFLILWKYAWGPMLKGLQTREDTIHKAVAEAKAAQAEAEKLRGQLAEEHAQAAEKVRAMLDEGRRDVEHMKAEMLAAGRAEVQAERERAKREIGTARDQALQDLWKQTAQLATMISAKALRRNINEEDHRRLVDESLAQLREDGTFNEQRQWIDL